MKHHLTKRIALLVSILMLLCWSMSARGQAGLPEQQPIRLAGEDLFQRLSPSVFVVEVFDEGGTGVALGSGVVIKLPSEERRESPPSFREFLESRRASFIVTNAHVVTQGFSVQVRQGSNSWKAEIEQIDPHFDLCLLKVEGLMAPAASLRKSDTVTIGEHVYAIGAPEGLELTLSDGLISGFRHLDERKVIQTTAPISHGSSGGGLFDVEGMLIGITSFFLSDSQNLNFAIPTDNIETLLLQQQSETAEGWIWIGDQAMNEQAPGPPLGLPPQDIGPEQEEWVERAKRQLEILRSSWRRGVHAYQMALRLDPNDYQAWGKLAGAYSRLGDPQNMTDSFQRAIRLKPNDVTICARFSAAYERLGDQVGAIEACNEALKQRPRDASLWANLAGAYGRSQSKSALSALPEAEQVAPVEGFTWWRIGSTYQLLHSYKEAESAYIKSIQFEPNNHLYLFNLGALYVLEHKRSKARDVYQRLEESSPAVAERLYDLLSAH